MQVLREYLLLSQTIIILLNVTFEISKIPIFILIFSTVSDFENITSKQRDFRVSTVSHFKTDVANVFDRAQS